MSKGKRRGHGEGSIYQRSKPGDLPDKPTGPWVAQLTVGTKPNGRPDLRYTYWDTNKEAIQGLQDMIQDFRQGLPVAPKKQKLSAYLEDWLENSVKPNVRPRTYASYSQLCHLYIIPALGPNYLTKLTAQQIRAFLNKLSQQKVKRTGKPMSVRTVRYCHSILSMALGDAAKLGLVPRNQATLIDPPKQEQREARYLTPEQATAFLDATRGSRLECLYYLAITVGLRSGELLGLTWDDVDIDAGRLTVRNSLQRIEGKLQLVRPKTERSQRTVALSKGAVAALRAHKKIRQNEERLQAGAKWEEHNLVFPNTEGKPYDAGNMVKLFHQDLERAGLPRINFHSLRHTCATLLLKQGVQMRTVMELLGHSQMAMTSDLYSHVVEELKREAAGAMDDLFGTGS